jgi:hypothetical protein
MGVKTMTYDTCVTSHTSQITCIHALSINCSERAQPASMLPYLPHESQTSRHII